MQKAGLVDLTEDDRAALLELADRLRGVDEAGVDPVHLATRWRRRGLRTFDADKQAAALGNLGEEQPKNVGRTPSDTRA